MTHRIKRFVARNYGSFEALKKPIAHANQGNVVVDPHMTIAIYEGIQTHDEVLPHWVARMPLGPQVFFGTL